MASGPHLLRSASLPSLINELGLNRFQHAFPWDYLFSRPKRPRFDALPDDPCVDELVTALGSGVNIVEVVRRARTLSASGRGGLGVEFLAAFGSGDLANVERDAFRRLCGLYGSTLTPYYFSPR